MGKAHAPGFLKRVTEARAGVTECTVADVVRRRAAGEKLTIVDVREESEYAAGHVPGAIHMSKGVIERDIEAKLPDAGAEVILYCGGGFRSVLAAESVQKMGYTNVISMDSGWREWTATGQPVEK